MLNKLATIANFADKNGEYLLADQIDEFIKTAGIFDAFRTLVDPSYGGLDNSSKYWTRLMRGFKKGRIDKKIGQIFSLSIEREQLDKEINTLAQPVADYKKVVDAFFTKLTSKSIQPESLKDEVKALKTSLKDMTTLLSSRRLTSLLKRRESIYNQTKYAVEKLKVISPEAKQHLVMLLSSGSYPTKELADKVKDIPVGEETISEGDVENVAQQQPVQLPNVQKTPQSKQQQPSQQAPKKKKKVVKDQYGGYYDPDKNVPVPANEAEAVDKENTEVNIPMPFGEKSASHKRNERLKVLSVLFK